MKEQEAWQKMLSNQEEILRVNSDDEIVGTIGKVEAHTAPGQLHRAITVLLFNQAGKCLLTQRSGQKPLWPTWWDFACSTHQWPDESDEAAAQRRMPFEIGVTAADITYLFQYEYHAVYNEQWAENEVNHILSGSLDTDPVPNPAEVSDWRWASPEEITAELQQPNHRFPPWVAPAWEKFLAGSV